MGIAGRQWAEGPISELYLTKLSIADAIPVKHILYILKLFVTEHLHLKAWTESLTYLN